MAILVIGGTGQIGSLVVRELASRGAQVRALATRKPPHSLPSGVELVTGDVLDVDFMRGLLRTVGTVFVLHRPWPTSLPGRCSPSRSSRRPASSAWCISP